MNETRRAFLRFGLGSSTLLACGAEVPGFLARSALAAPPAAKGTGRVLVVLELSGGNDGLNTVVPYGDDLYRKHRPRLAIAASALHKVDGHVGLHPALFRMARMLQGGKLSVVQSVGYPNANRSHFESMAIWHTANLNPTAQTSGWLNQSSARRTEPSDGDGDAMHIGDSELPRALVGDALSVPSLTSLDQVVRRLGVPGQIDADAHRAALDRVMSQPRGGPGSHLQFVQRSQLVTYASSARIEEVLRQGKGRSSAYPDTGLARRFELIARLIKAGLTTSIYYLQLEGFDTHQAQLDVHAALLQTLDGALAAFFDDLDEAGESRRVLLLAFSEFGRRLGENASRGTDHGTAAPVFLAGPGVEPGLHGPYPDLADLEDGDPRHTIDFRRIYATVLDRWLNSPSRVVLGADFPHLAVL
jgi:uncharacterized protein (DUF1501 family)